MQNRECLFGEIVDCEMILNEMGQIACVEWLKTAELRTNVQLHNFVVMPNHFHGILEITKTINVDDLTNDGALRVGALRATPLQMPAQTTSPPRPFSRIPTNAQKNEYMSEISPKSGVLGTIVRAYKSAVTRNIRLAGYGFAWQRNMWEHVIRDFDDYARIADYIDNNPARWQNDRFFME